MTSSVDQRDTESIQRVLVPGAAAPSLEIDTVGGPRWILAESQPTTYSIVIFYRGRFCNVCRRYLPEIQAHASALAERGADLVVISADDLETAQATKSDWGLDDLTIGYGLEPQTMLDWGLFMSEADPGRAMPAVFSEPGLFLIKPDKTVFYEAVSSAPIGRPSIDELVGWLDFISEREGGYPTRGSYRP